jgi:hypothetical protein
LGGFPMSRGATRSKVAGVTDRKEIGWPSSQP